MKKIAAFGASNSKNSLNHQLALWAARQIEKVDIVEVRLDDFEMPIYSIDREKASGIPQLAQDFKQIVNESDGIIISFAEYNGSFSSAFKNIYDWMSRISRPIWSDKPMMLLSTSPGGGGGARVIRSASELFPHQGAKINGMFSLPSFSSNFDDGITNAELLETFRQQLQLFKQSLI